MSLWICFDADVSYYYLRTLKCLPSINCDLQLMAVLDSWSKAQPSDDLLRLGSSVFPNNCAMSPTCATLVISFY